MSPGDEEQIDLLGEPPLPEEPANGNGHAEDPPAEIWFAWEGDGIDLSEAMLDRGHAYGSYVNTSRAIPDVRDGLKPVQRRILFAMDELGLRSDRPYRKSATTVGHVVGHYHPHGDAPVYDAMVRMAQDFQSATSLVDGQGNWGNVDGDPAAAMRYTEARLTQIATESMADLRPEVVAYRDNFSETKQEATVLPVTVPLLLTLGVSGIGWSMACDIPPHNLGEVLKAAVIVAKHPNAGLERIMAAMPAPDFPGGGIIPSTAALAQIYATGQGTIQLQARYLIEDLPGGIQAVLVTELPYQVGPDQIVRQVVQAARDGKITEVVEMPRNLTGRDTGPRVQIKAKRGGSVQKLVADLMRHTSLRSTVKFNLTVLADGKPRVLGLVEILRRFVDFRLEVVTKRLDHERAVLWRELHRLLGLMAAVGAIDEVVQIIRDSEDDDDAKAKLQATLTYVPHGGRGAVPIDEQQATWIIEMQLRRLNRLNRFRLQDEVKAKGQRIDEIAALLASEHGVRDIVVTELEDARARHATPRRTGIQSGPAQGTLAAAASADVPAPVPGGAIGDVTMTGGPVAIFAADLGQIMVCDPNMRRIPRVPLQVASGAALVAAFDLPAPRPLIAVTANGLAYKVSPYDGMPETRRSRGRQVVAIERGDRVVAVFPDDGSATHAALVTAGGQLKRVEWSMLQSAHAAGVVCFKLPAGDCVAAVVPHGDQDEILIATAQGRLLRTDLGAIRPVQTGGAGGVAGMSLGKGDRVVSAVRLAEDDLVTLHASGFAKRTAVAEYPTKGRGTGGVVSAGIDKPSRGPAGEVAFVACLPREGDLVLVTGQGESAKVGAADLPAVARAAVSRPLVPMAESDRPVLVTPGGPA